ncbi:hypothetical protein SRABI70_03177 [Pseudomonas sp. Bi70]|nr:hypothetical protein SRABI70_03177 [Pseudomonas sp. Bi70]
MARNSHANRFVNLNQPALFRPKQNRCWEGNRAGVARWQRNRVWEFGHIALSSRPFE